MAEDDHTIDEVDEQEVADGASKDKRKAAKGVDSVTDFVQEKSAAVDESKLQNVVGSIGTVKETIQATSVALKDEDVKTLAEECEVAKEAAEALLKKHGGDLRAAMVAFARGL